MGKLRIRARLGTCGRCDGRLGNPLTHVCVTRAGRPRRRTKTRIRPRVSVAVKCKTCGKRYANPVTHVCTVKASPRQKLAAAGNGKRKAAGPPRVKVIRPGGAAGPASHPYQSCRDADCERRSCVIWREARAEGYADGLDAGYREGHRDGHKRGWNEGFAAGRASSS